ncbi:antirestriction protein ArdA [Bacillus thuringiensis]|uniref:antirestriction protein ArdA n=1 Tax=Bacillus thuringiensis TaxID=1428 RepID=UPI000BA1DBDC|nr:antirestriction protein ArdA [Bacillus thuringiensis]
MERIGNLDEETYEAFLILAKHMSLNLACGMARRNEFRIYREVKDVGDLAYQLLQEDAEFQKLPDFVKRHFDYDGYGEELESTSSFYEDFKNEVLLVIHN